MSGFALVLPDLLEPQASATATPGNPRPERESDSLKILRLFCLPLTNYPESTSATTLRREGR